jgi:hypothetical protein
MDNGGVVGYGVSCHFQQYFSHIVAFSFVSVASHWQTLSHNDGHASIYLKNIYILISKTWYRIEWALNCMIYQYNLYYIVFVVIGDHLFN